jgi:hypothetical protein
MMSSLSHPLQFVLVALAGWVNRQQRDVIDYLQEENRVLREQFGPDACGSRTISAVGSP